MRKAVGLVVFVGVSQMAGVIGSLFTVGGVGTWYAGLVRPVFTPPNWVFGPVWVMLYALMGVAAYLVWLRSDGRLWRGALAVFGLQLVLNALWSVLFFGLQNPLFALVEIVVLWLVIVWTMVLFYRISRPAAYMLVPYILWVSFATCLNYAIWILN